MQAKIKIQHYIPRFYLRNFSTLRGKVYAINCFGKVEGKMFAVDIAKIGAEKYFYDTQKDTNQKIERILGRFESRFNVAYDKVIKTEELRSLSRPEKITFAYFISTQELRTREFREHLKDTVKQLSIRLSKEKLSPELSSQLKEASTEEAIKSRQIELLIRDTPTFVNIMMRMKWILFKNKTKFPYWTSDHPVNRYNHIKSQLGNLGLVCSGIEIYFPLSKTLSLCICDPIMFRSFPEKHETTNEQGIVFQNKLQVRSCTRHIFSADQDFSLAEKMVKDYPELRDIDRKRVTVD